MMPRVTHVFGLSGVGKSWLCERFANCRHFAHVSASTLLRAAKKTVGETTDSEGLRKGPILDNQELLIQQFRMLRADEARPILLDAHNMIDDGTSLVEIPLAVIRDLTPDLIVFIRAEPELIYERRASDKTRQRPVRNIRTLKEHQEQAWATARSHAAELGVPVYAVEAGDEVTFAAVIIP